MKNLGQWAMRKEIVFLALPMILQNLVSSFLNLVDTFMIGKLGANEIAAVGLANNLYFIFMLLLFGTNSGISIFTAQFHGKSDHKNVKKSVAFSVTIGVFFALIFTIIGLVLPKIFMKTFIEDGTVIVLGSEYLFITAFSYIITAISFSVAFAYRSTGHPRVPLVISSIALITNTGLNYVLIFGMFGIPAMGVAGAAYATVIARIIECGLMLFAISKQEHLVFSIHDVFRPSISFAKKVLKTSLPVIANEFIWALGIVMYSAAFAKIGTDAVATLQIGNSVINLYSVVFFGLGNACAVLVGREIGGKNLERAEKMAKEIMKVSAVAAIAISILQITTSQYVVSYFNVSPLVMADAKMILIISGLFNLFRVFNINMVVGVLRSGGDTIYSLIMELGSIWLIGVPCAFIGALVFKLPVPWVYAMIMCEELVKSLFGFYRYKSKKWLKNLVEDLT